MTSSPQQRAVRLVVVLLIASIGAGVLSTGLAVATHAAKLGPNQILIFLVAILYVWVIRKLRAGSPAAYRRVRIVSAAGFVAVAWQLVAAAYPLWFRPLQVAQLTLLAALIVAVNRPVMRAAFPRVPDLRPRNRRAALVLALLAPVVAEVSLGTVPLRMAWAWLVFAPVYSAGVLFLREALRRTGGGYANLLILGVAYGLAEEGLALQSLTSPHLYGAAGWAPRLLGINTAYTELNLVYHAVFSVTIPVVLTELIFAGHGPRPYLRRGGMIASGVIALLALALLRVSIPPAEDPGYTMPLLAVVIVAALIVAALVLGLRLRFGPARQSPPSRPTRRSALLLPTRWSAAPRIARRPASLSPARWLPAPRVARRSASLLPARRSASLLPARRSASLLPARRLPAPRHARRSALARPALVAIGAAVATFAFLALVWPFGDSERHGWWPLIPMTIAAAVVVAAVVVPRRWEMTPRHLIAACCGALVAHTLFGLVANADTSADRLFLAGVALLTAVLGVAGLRRIPAAVPSDAVVPSGVAVPGEAVVPSGVAVPGGAVVPSGVALLGGEGAPSCVAAPGVAAVSGGAGLGEPVAEALAREFDEAVGQPRESEEDGEEAGHREQLDRAVQADAEVGELGSQHGDQRDVEQVDRVADDAEPGQEARRAAVAAGQTDRE